MAKKKNEPEVIISAPITHFSAKGTLRWEFTKYRKDRQKPPVSVIDQ